MSKLYKTCKSCGKKVPRIEIEGGNKKCVLCASGYKKKKKKGK